MTNIPSPTHNPFGANVVTPIQPEPVFGINLNGYLITMFVAPIVKQFSDSVAQSLGMDAYQWFSRLMSAHIQTHRDTIRSMGDSPYALYTIFDNVGMLWLKREGNAVSAYLMTSGDIELAVSVLKNKGDKISLSWVQIELY